MRLRNNKTTNEFEFQPSILEPQHFSDSQSSSTKKFVGVSKLRDGFCARIPHPVTRKQIWLGTFKSAEEASMVVLAKKTEFEEKQRKTELEEKQRIQGGVCDEESNKVVEQSDECLGGNHDNDPSEKNQDSSMQIGSRKLRIAEEKESCDFSGRKIDGVSKSKSGKYVARIRHPVSKKQIWLGTFGSGEEASMVCSEKKAELEKELQGKKRKRIQGGVCDEQVKEFVDQSGQCLEENGTNICEEKQVDSRKAKVSKRKKKKNQDSSLKIDAKEARISKKKNCRISERTVVGLVGVSKSKSGKYVAKIRHPITKKHIWLGTFGTAEEASMAFLAKKTELRKEMQEKGVERSTNHLGPILDESNHDPCLNNQDSAMKIENIDSLNGESVSRMEDLPIQRNVLFVEKEVSVDSSVCSESGAEILLRTESGVPLMDSHGYLLGSWSWIDDLSLPIV